MEITRFDLQIKVVLCREGGGKGEREGGREGVEVKREGGLTSQIKREREREHILKHIDFHKSTF